MIELFLGALFQVAAGAPETPATTPAPTAEEQAQTEQAAAATETRRDRGIQCRRVANTGTHLGRRICTTAEQRRRQQENVDHDIDALFRQNEGGGIGPNPGQ